QAAAPRCQAKGGRRADTAECADQPQAHPALTLLITLRHRWRHLGSSRFRAPGSAADYSAPAGHRGTRWDGINGNHAGNTVPFIFSSRRRRVKHRARGKTAAFHTIIEKIGTVKRPCAAQTMQSTPEAKTYAGYQ